MKKVDDLTLSFVSDQPISSSKCFFFSEYFPLLESKQMTTCCTVIWILGCPEEQTGFSSGISHCGEAVDECCSDLNLGFLFWRARSSPRFFFPLQVFHNVIDEAGDEFSLIWILGCPVGQGFLFGLFQVPKEKILISSVVKQMTSCAVIWIFGCLSWV